MAILILIIAPLAVAGEELPDAPTKIQKSKQKAQARIESGTDTWRTTIESLDFPSLIFVFGKESSDPAQAVGMSLSPDHAGFTEDLANSIVRLMQRAEPDTDVISPKGIRQVDAGVQATIRGNVDSPEAALELLQQAFDADYTVWAKFIPQGQSIFRVVCEVLDTRGRTYAVSEGWTVRDGDIRSVASAIFVELANTFDRITNRTAVRYTFHLFGIKDSRQLTKISRQLKHVDGVRSAKPKGFKRSREGGSYGVLQLLYGGEYFDIAFEVQELVEQEFGYTIGELQSTPGAVVLKLTDAREAPAWHVLTDPEAADPHLRRDAFRAAYTQRGGLKVGVMIKEQRWVKAVEDDWRSGQEEGERDTASAFLIVDAMPSTTVQTLEDALAGAFSDAGVDVTDGHAVREQLTAQLEVQYKPRGGLASIDADPIAPGIQMTDTILGDALTKISPAYDVLVVGQVVNNQSEPGESARLRYTFRATDIKNHRVLGTQAWPDPRSQTGEFKVDKASDRDVARFIAGNILDQLYRNHLQDGTYIDVRIDNAASVRQIQQLAELFRRTIPGVLSVADPRFDTHKAQGRFRVRFEGTYEDLLSRIVTNAGKMAMDIETAESSPSLIVLQVQSYTG